MQQSDEPILRHPPRHKKPSFPLIEGVGILIGVMAWDLLNDGYVNIDKAFLIAVPCTLIWFAIRCWRYRIQNRPNEAEACTPVIEKAYQQGIPVILVDRKIATESYTAYVGANNYQIGKEAGLYAIGVLKGKGNILRTGKLGDVMQESISAAWSVVRSRAEVLGIAPDFYEKTDIHVHVPEGATPKDGPSAGIGMTLAIVSSLTGIPVRADVAMTGEITLRACSCSA